MLIPKQISLSGTKSFSIMGIKLFILVLMGICLAGFATASSSYPKTKAIVSALQEKRTNLNEYAKV